MLAEVSRKMIAPRALSAKSHTHFSKHPVPRIVRNHRESYPVRQLMPPFKDVLDAGQINDVIAYVKTL